MTKRTSSDLIALAKSAAVDAADADSVGEYLETVDEGDSTYTYLFTSNLKGYQGWKWSVTLFAPSKQDPTISEVLLLPGEGSLLAPAWVPWAERLADWKALQAELEAQAAAELDEADGVDEGDDENLDEDVEDASESEADQDFEVLDDDETTLSDEEESAFSDSEQGVDSEQDSDDAGPRPPRFGRRNRRRKNDKNRKN